MCFSCFFVLVGCSIFFLMFSCCVVLFFYGSYIYIVIGLWMVVVSVLVTFGSKKNKIIN
jgi:hypothetical protein